MDLSNLIYFAAEQAAEYADKPSALGTLGINWKLFLAQLVNFGIVVFILWRWIFRPVAGALESRRQKIETSIKQAEEIEQRMKKFEIEQEELMKKARAEGQKIVKKSQVAAESMEKEIVGKARQGAEKIIKSAQNQIEQDKQRALREAREELANLVVMASERIIREKLDREKDKKLIEEAVRNF